MSDTTRTWIDLPHPFENDRPNCPMCGGYGTTHAPDAFPARCTECNGTGIVTIDERIFDASLDGIGPSQEFLANPDRVTGAAD